MTDISFTLDTDMAEQIGLRAAKAGQTGSDYIASNLRHWLEGDDLAGEIAHALERLSQTVAVVTR